jgi:hypothetical protein
MRNLMTFKIFESQGFSSYGFGDIKKLPGYLLLVSIGYYDASTNAIKNHMNMRLYNKELGLDSIDKNIMVYSNGYVRKVIPGRWDPKPYIMKKFDGENNLARWNEQFLYIYDWTQKQYEKQGINSQYKGINKSDFTSPESIIKYMIGAYSGNRSASFSIYDSLEDLDKEKFLKGIKTSKEEFEIAKEKYDRVIRTFSSGLF